jgi:ribosomal protein S18 acetylase RimI-like enzyme
VALQSTSNLAYSVRYINVRTWENALSFIEIRLANMTDTESVANMFDQYRQFYEQAANIKLAEEFITARIINQQSIILVAENAGELVGFCQMYPTFCSVEAAPIVVLYDLFVVDIARKTGAGRALMLAAQSYAKENGFTRLDLSTAKTNVNAQALYESLGWQRDSQFYYYSLKVN